MPSVINTATAERLEQILLDCINNDTVPEEILRMKEFRSFTRILKYRKGGCIYLTSIIKVMVHKHPEAQQLLQEVSSE